MRIHFFDPVAKRPYSLKTLQSEGMGGTEGTVVRIAEKLAETHEVIVSQSARGDAETSSPVSYVPAGRHSADVTVVLRDPGALEGIEGPKVLWMHDLCVSGDITDEHRKTCEEVTVVGVSDFHKNNLSEFLPNVKRIYNPVAEGLKGGLHNPKKLIFCSSPHKGLDRTLQVFAGLKKHGFRLYIANPGYWTAQRIHTKHVLPLDSLPHDRLMKHLGESFAMLQVNDVFPETFGLVYAEANALGTPCLTCDIGAAQEVLGKDQVLPEGSTNKDFIERILDWSENRPKVGPRPEFQLKTVAQQWERLLMPLATL